MIYFSLERPHPHWWMVEYPQYVAFLQQWDYSGDGPDSPGPMFVPMPVWVVVVDPPAEFQIPIPERLVLQTQQPRLIIFDAYLQGL